MTKSYENSWKRHKAMLGYEAPPLLLAEIGYAAVLIAVFGVAMSIILSDILGIAGKLLT